VPLAGLFVKCDNGPSAVPSLSSLSFLSSNGTVTVTQLVPPAQQAGRCKKDDVKAKLDTPDNLGWKLKSNTTVVFPV
jgi:hypothetical protein